jgi:N-acyl-D-amino-acid deacylase
MRRRDVGCLFVLAISSAARAADAAPPVAESDLRSAVGKALPPIQHSQDVWDKKQECASCHHQFLPVVAFKLALDRGIAFDGKAAHGVAAKTFAPLKDIDEAVQHTYFIDVPEVATYLVAAHEAGVRPSPTTAGHAQFVAGYQRPDGSWRPMDHRPPQSHSPVISTAYCLRALQLYMPESRKAETDERVRNAREWLLKSQPAPTTDRVNRLLGLKWAGTDDAVIQDAAQQLFAEQRDDGGWAQLPRMSSDAYATGETLHVLHTAAGIPTSHPAYQRALRFLLKTQEPDGSWRVETRLHPPAPISPPYFDSKFPHGRSQFVSIMGTTWAAAAMSHALPKSASPVAAATLDVAPAARDPWITTALTGTAADLKKHLDAGLSPNAKTAGGTTVLMMAARDPEKVKLLLDAGADPNARAASGFTALMIAAQQRGNVESVRLLLAKGADAAPKAGEKVRFDAHALFYAATTGDTAMAELLLNRGADPRRPMNMLGMFPASPMTYAVFNADAAMTALLLRRGADVNEIEPQTGVGLLAWAVLGNRAALIPPLVEKGASVNHVDNLGMTPLLYAASVDFGDTAAIDALLTAGADVTAKNKGGLTALQLARKYGHTAIAERLSSTRKGE